MKPDPPAVEVLWRGNRRAAIRCCYCNSKHTHQIHGYGKQRFAPQCGQSLNPEQRATGYQFQFN